jgi:hypothetical protein
VREYVPFSERPSLLSFLLNRKPASETDTDVVGVNIVEAVPMQPQASIKKIEEKAEAKVETTTAAPLPEQVQARDPNAQIADDNDSRPSFFSRLFDTSDEAKKTDESTPVVETVTQDTATIQAPAAPVVQEKQLQQPTPLVTTTAAPVAPVATDGAAIAQTGAKAAAAAANMSSSVPSPRLLDQVKMLPVSRYSARTKAIKQPSDDN